jgi:hypothetical protein
MPGIEIFFEHDYKVIHVFVSEQMGCISEIHLLFANQLHGVIHSPPGKVGRQTGVKALSELPF